MPAWTAPGSGGRALQRPAEAFVLRLSRMPAYAACPTRWPSASVGARQAGSRV